MILCFLLLGLLNMNFTLLTLPHLANEDRAQLAILEFQILNIYFSTSIQKCCLLHIFSKKKKNVRSVLFTWNSKFNEVFFVLPGNSTPITPELWKNNVLLACIEFWNFTKSPQRKYLLFVTHRTLFLTAHLTYLCILVFLEGTGIE